MLLDRFSVYEVIVELREIEVKLKVHIIHKVNHVTYMKDGKYDIRIKEIYYNKKNLSPENIYRELISRFNVYKENFTAVSAKEISL